MVGDRFHRMSLRISPNVFKTDGDRAEHAWYSLERACGGAREAETLYTKQNMCK